MIKRFNEKAAIEEFSQRQKHLYDLLSWTTACRWQHSQDLRTMVPREKVEKLISEVDKIMNDSSCSSYKALGLYKIALKEFEAEGE